MKIFYKSESCEHYKDLFNGDTLLSLCSIKLTILIIHPKRINNNALLICNNKFREKNTLKVEYLLFLKHRKSGVSLAFALTFFERKERIIIVVFAAKPLPLALKFTHMASALTITFWNDTWKILFQKILDGKVCEYIISNLHPLFDDCIAFSMVLTSYSNSPRRLCCCNNILNMYKNQLINSSVVCRVKDELSHFYHKYALKFSKNIETN